MSAAAVNRAALNRAALNRAEEWARVLGGTRRHNQVDDPTDLVRRALALGGDVDPAVVACSLTVEAATGWTTPHASHPVARILDNAQYEAGTGPCVEAAITGQVQQLDAIGARGRFRAFAAVALDQGVHSSLSVPLPREGQHAALNIYAGHTAAFSAARSREVASLLARVVGRLLGVPDLAARRSAPEVEIAATQGAIVRDAVALLAAAGDTSLEEAYLQLAVRSGREGRAIAHLAATVLGEHGPSQAVSA